MYRVLPRDMFLHVVQQGLKSALLEHVLKLYLTLYQRVPCAKSRVCSEALPLIPNAINFLCVAVADSASIEIVLPDGRDHHNKSGQNKEG